MGAQAQTAKTRTGRVVRAIAGYAGMTDAEMASELGLTRESLSRKLNGQAAFHETDMDRIAEVLRPFATDLAADLDRVVRANHKYRGRNPGGPGTSQGVA